MLCGCSFFEEDESAPLSDSSFKGKANGETLRILSGSENRELAAVLADCAKKTGVNIEMTYKGSVDIMHELQSGAANFDAVWSASSLWISLGDTHHLVKHDQSISTSPVVFGIRKSSAERLGFVGKEVSVNDILEVIKSGRLNFCMTSATQSNSGASAYIGFLSALLGKSSAITSEDLDDPDLSEKISSLLSGVERSSGSSDWLKDMFLDGEFDAMVNYECLIISANNELIKRGKEPLYIVYPYDGLSVADSPLGYIDHKNERKEKAFLDVQEYLLSNEAQDKIEATGRRISMNSVSEKNKAVFNEEWGIDVNRVLSPITMPAGDVLLKALNLYQSSFRKPSLTIYCLDFSGSMEGSGNRQLLKAMNMVLNQKNARQYLLQAETDEVNIVIPFSSHVFESFKSVGNDDAELEALYNSIEETSVEGGTDMYLALIEALEMLSEYDLSEYTPSVILMTDGASRTNNLDEFEEKYSLSKNKVPIFSILFGSAKREQLDDLAKLSNARVFDGREDIIGAFRSVKGYN